MHGEKGLQREAPPAPVLAFPRRRPFANALHARGVGGPFPLAQYDLVSRRLCLPVLLQPYRRGDGNLPLRAAQARATAQLVRAREVELGLAPGAGVDRLDLRLQVVAAQRTRLIARTLALSKSDHDSSLYCGVIDESESWAQQLQAALIEPLGGNDPVPPEARERGAQFVKRAKLLMGTGIDPAAVLNSLEGYKEAIRHDPTCVEAYVGLGKAAQFLAARRPAHAADLLGPALRWLARASISVGKLQESKEIHGIENRLREARRAASGRPKPAGEAVHVQLERDEEGRVLRGRGMSFRTDSGELPALIPGLPVPPQASGQRIPRWIPITAGVLLVLGLSNVVLGNWPPMLNGLVIGAGIVVLALPLLVWSGRWTKGIAPALVTVCVFAVCIVAADQLQVHEPPPTTSTTRFDKHLGPLYPDLQPLLRIGIPLAPQFGLSKLAVVEETGDAQHPLQTDVLHDQLPPTLRANTPSETRYVVIVRRFSGRVHHMLVLWVLDPAERRLLAHATLSGKAPTLERAALAWMERL